MPDQHTMTNLPSSSSLLLHQSRKRPASPVSISEAAERVATLQNRSQKRRHTARSRPGALAKSASPSPKKATRTSRNSTPQSSHNDTQVTAIPTHAPRPIRPVHQQLSQIQNSASTPPPIFPQHHTPSQTHQQETPLTLSPQLAPKAIDDDDVDMNGSPTPHEDGDSDNTVQVDSPAPISIETGIAGELPLSLPNPSLSPVTAALHHGSQGYFSAMET